MSSNNQIRQIKHDHSNILNAESRTWWLFNGKSASSFFHFGMGVSCSEAPPES